MLRNKRLRLAQAGLLALILIAGSLHLSSLTPHSGEDPSAAIRVPRAHAAPAAPALASPPADGTLANFGPTLTWANPAGTQQVHFQVLPANNDGPAIDLLLGTPVTSYQVPAPPAWYGLLPGMSYTWRVRVSDAATSVPLTDPSWGPWAERKFRTPNITADVLRAQAPVRGGFVTTMTPPITWASSRPDIFYYEFQLSKDQTFTTDPTRAVAMVYEALLHGGVTTPLNSYQVPRDFPLEPNSVYYWRVRPRIQGDGAPTPWGPVNIFRTVTPNPQVVFAGHMTGVTDGLDLIVANADGSSPRSITPRQFDDLHPSWSPNRRQIVFVSGREGEAEAVYIVNADGSGERRLSPPGIRAFRPAWSPDGEKIAFELETSPAGTDIVVIRPDGSGMVNVSANPSAAETQPGWSPNSTHLVYTQKVGENDAHLYVAAWDGSGKRKLTGNALGNEDMASWSPDGSRIVYSYGASASQTNELIVIGADGSNPRSLARGIIADWPPQWSPDGGSRILYVAGGGAEASGGRSVWTINADGSAAKNIGGNNEWTEDTPFWSPDGTRISFTSNRADLESAGGVHLYIMNADGTGKVRVGNFNTSVHVRDAGIWPPM